MSSELLEKLMEELSIELAKFEKGKVEDEWPKVGDEYWYVSDYSLVPASAIYIDNELGRNRKALGIIFSTKEEAMAERHTELIRQRDYFEGEVKRLRAIREHLERSNASLRGHLKRMKKKLASSNANQSFK